MAVFMIRHGETDWNDGGRIQGWAPVSLNDHGRSQARLLAAHLEDTAPVERIVTSDLPRARGTAELIAAELDIPVRTDEQWRERDFGVYQGLTADSFFERFPRFDLLETGEAAAKVVPETGENWYGVEARILDAWESLLGRDESTAVVTHSNPIKLVLAELKGMDIIEGLTRQSVPNCSVSRIDGSDAPRLTAETTTSFL